MTQNENRQKIGGFFIYLKKYSFLSRKYLIIYYEIKRLKPVQQLLTSPYQLPYQAC